MPWTPEFKTHQMLQLLPWTRNFTLVDQYWLVSGTNSGTIEL